MDGNLLLIFPAAFLGGLILNVMPCVLPVLTMKVFHLIEHADDDEATHRMHGIAYTAGVLATFLAFSIFVIVLRASGEAVGWGMQFQNPSFVAAMIAVIFVFGLNALGVFEFTVSVQQGEKQRSGFSESFANGVVASIMSTPCSAPFLAGAAAFALTAPSWQTLVVFQIVGLGLAAPFALVSFFPAIGRILPRPGAWMETFKHLMGFTLIAAAIWLYSVFQKQVSYESAQWFLGLLLVLGVGAWAWDRFGGPMETNRRRWIVRTVVLGSASAFAFGFVRFEPPENTAAEAYSGQVVVDGEINWAPFDPAMVDAARAANRPVFVDYTADWCANCLTNERLFIEVQPIRDLLVETGILPMKADLTNEDDTILAWLDDLGRAGIPVYAIYMPDGSVDLLPQAITTELLADRLNAASAAWPPSAYGSMPFPGAECEPVGDAPNDGADSPTDGAGEGDEAAAPVEEASLLR